MTAAKASQESAARGSSANPSGRLPRPKFLPRFCHEVRLCGGFLRIDAVRWLKDREALHHASHKDEACRLNKHMVRRLGHMVLDEVRPRHIRDFVHDLRKGR
jgi:hypothetical protein